MSNSANWDWSPISERDRLVEKARRKIMQALADGTLAIEAEEILSDLAADAYRLGETT